MFLWILVAGSFASFYNAWGIGANDCANSFATSVGAKVLTLRKAIIIAGVFEFLGALFILIGPFTKDILTRVGGTMLAVIMLGAIYMHLFKWGDGLGDVEWQMLLLAVSLFFVFKGDEI